VKITSPHIEVLLFTRPIDEGGIKQGWLAYVRCTLDGMVLTPLVLFRQPDRCLRVMAFDWTEQRDGVVVNVRSRFRGIHLDDPRLSPGTVEQITQAVLERARAEGIR
jgi:hypothetical protein